MHLLLLHALLLAQVASAAAPAAAGHDSLLQLAALAVVQTVPSASPVADFAAHLPLAHCADPVAAAVLQAPSLATWGLQVPASEYPLAQSASVAPASLFIFLLVHIFLVPEANTFSKHFKPVAQSPCCPTVPVHASPSAIFPQTGSAPVGHAFPLAHCLSEPPVTHLVPGAMLVVHLPVKQ
jgi:hypothetical protein